MLNRLFISDRITMALFKQRTSGTCTSSLLPGRLKPLGGRDREMGGEIGSERKRERGYREKERKGARDAFQIKH